MRPLDSIATRLTLVVLAALQLPVVARGQGNGAAGPAELARLAQELHRRGIGADPLAPIGSGVSLDAAQRDSAYGRSVRARAARIDSTRLSHEERLTLAIVRWEAWKLEQGPRLWWYSFPFTPAFSPMQTMRAAATAQPLATRRDLDTYLARVDQAGALFTGAMRKTRMQLARGIVIPREQVDIVLPYLRSYAQTEANPLEVSAVRLTALPRAASRALWRRAPRRSSRSSTGRCAIMRPRAWE